ncbi:hypothetical protein MLD38_006201 [Melastoma candidum]|uniref:Uncharacterized protein n=1 Tax=Melastoma candidum TaxID=119954 RepID=A0ACB9RLS9_9MYRT|nr:hypothetical protein MLD38_006201 [Melastoma candidum]
MEEFGETKFLKRMHGKTLAFIGDSLGRQQFQSLMCMVTGGKDRPDVLDVGKDYGLVKSRGAVRPRWVGLSVSKHQHPHTILLVS